MAAVKVGDHVKFVIGAPGKPGSEVDAKVTKVHSPTNVDLEYKDPSTGKMKAYPTINEGTLQNQFHV